MVVVSGSLRNALGLVGRVSRACPGVPWHPSLPTVLVNSPPRHRTPTAEAGGSGALGTMSPERLGRGSAPREAVICPRVPPNLVPRGLSSWEGESSTGSGPCPVCGLGGLGRPPAGPGHWALSGGPGPPCPQGTDFPTRDPQIRPLPPPSSPFSQSRRSPYATQRRLPPLSPVLSPRLRARVSAVTRPASLPSPIPDAEAAAWLPASRPHSHRTPSAPSAPHHHPQRHVQSTALGRLVGAGVGVGCGC